MPFFKSATKRPLIPVPVAREAAVAEPLAVETLMGQLREVLPARRLQSVSLCDHEANVLWLSEGALGPDEHSLVTEALMLLTADVSLPSYEIGLEDGRLALFLPVRAPNGRPVGIAMILADRRSVSDDTLERLSAAPVRAIMQRLAVLLKPTDANMGSGTEPIPILEFASDEEVRKPAPPVARAPVAATPSRKVTPVMVASTEPVISGEEIDDILEFEMPTADSQPVAVPRVEPHPFAANRQELAMSLELDSDATPAISPELAPADMLELDFEPAVATRTAARPVTPAPAPPPRTIPTLAPATRATAPAHFPPAPALAVSHAIPKPVLSQARAPERAPPSAVAPVATVAPVAAAAPVPAPPAAVAVAPAPVARAPFARGSFATAPTILTPEVLEAGAAAVNDPNLTLELLPFAKLRAGGQTRRFQVLARGSSAQRDPAAFDALVLQRLLGWLAVHRASWNTQPTSFTINLSIATLEDERFAPRVAAALNTHGISAETIGFEIAEALCTQRRAQVERFITACAKVGSWVVIDDFSFDSQVLTLLRSKALRLVKIDSKLTSSALKDKLSQAMVVATVQASKVLGIHCAAKRVDSQAQLQWLTAIGCDFAQGQALAGPQPLDFLASSPDPTGISALAMPS